MMDITFCLRIAIIAVGAFLFAFLNVDPRISAERINGTPENDNLTGTMEEDRIRGGTGNDTLVGLSGDDLIDGGQGNDNRWFGGR